MDDDLQALRRVVLGLGSGDDMKPAIEAAAVFAAALKSELFCLLVEQQDLVSYARLPFAKAFGRGGLVSALTTQSIESHFNRVFRDAERVLAQACARTNVTWRIERPQGEFFGEISAVLEHGDTVVVSERDLQGAGHLPLDAIRRLLAVAAAVVLPPRRAMAAGPIILLGDGRAASIALGFSRATGNKVEIMTPAELRYRRRPAAIIVASLQAIEFLDDAALFRNLAGTGAVMVLVSDQLTEPEPPPR